MNKKYSTFKLFFVVLLTMFSVSTFAQECPDDEIWYTSMDGKVVTKTNRRFYDVNFDVSIVSNTYTDGKGIIKFDGKVTIMGTFFRDCSSLTSITIPNSVTSIEERAFQGCSSLTSITIPNSVTSIGDMAFEGCSSLTSITIPDYVTSIGDKVFSGCSSLTSIIFPNSVTSIGSSAFGNCSSLTSITIPTSVTNIGDYAFYNCSSLTSITIPNSVTSIGSSAFYCCKFEKSEFINNSSSDSEANNYWGATIYDVIQSDGLCVKNNVAVSYRGKPSSITIPNSITSIGDMAFEGCSSLTSITIPNSVTSIGQSAFYNCPSLTSVTIGNSVTSIGWRAFEGCSSLTSITIPNSVTSIENEAFQYCSSLTSVTIGNSVTSIGERAFSYCSNVKELIYAKGTVTALATGLTSIEKVTIPNSVTSIGGGAFWGCSSLTSITIPNSVTSIGQSAFYNCSSLTSITIPNSVTSIGERTFEGCSSLTSITFPNSVTSIGQSAFYNCSSLTSITIPNSVTSIENEVFYGCTSLTSVTIGNSVTRIRTAAFCGCSSLTSITIPNSVTSIGKDSFYRCSSLTSISIPNSVTSIGDNAFYKCSRLAFITIPTSVTNIGNEAFYGCTSLSEVYVLWSNPLSITSNVFDHNSKGKIEATLYVPIGKTHLYLSADVWDDFADIKEWDPDSEVPVESISLSNNNLKIYANETYQLVATAMPGNATNKEVSWTSSNTKVATVSEEGLVTAVAVGSTTLTCTARDGSGVSASCNVTVLASRDMDVTLSAAGYATFFSSEYDYTLPSGCKAQVVTGCNDNILTYETIAGESASNIIPKNTAVLLVATSLGGQTIRLKHTDSHTTYTGTNYLHGSDVETTTSAQGNCYFYKLTKGNDLQSDVFGWFWGANNGAAFKIDGHRAWLAIPKGSATRSAFFMETGVDDLTGEPAEEQTCYDLQGRKVNEPTHTGIYIMNGKKVFIHK